MSGTCKSTLSLLAAFVDGALSPADDAALRAHLADCPRCTEFLESYRATGRVIGAATDVEIPPDVEDRLRAFLARTVTK
jgi:anti-sigma factor RsiW